MPKSSTPNLNEEEKKSQEKKIRNAEFFRQIKSDYRWKIFGRSALTTLVSIFLFAGVGYGIDWLIGKGHTFLIIMLIISYPVTQFTLYKKLKDFNPHKK